MRTTSLLISHQHRPLLWLLLPLLLVSIMFGFSDGKLTSQLKIKKQAMEAARKGDTKEYNRLMQLFKEASKGNKNK